MRTQSLDTDLSIEKVLISLLRKANMAKKFSQVCSLSQTAMQLSKRAISRANKNLSEEQINILFVAYHYGEDLAHGLKDYLDKLSNDKT